MATVVDKGLTSNELTLDRLGTALQYEANLLLQRVRFYQIVNSSKPSSL